MEEIKQDNRRVHIIADFKMKILQRYSFECAETARRARLLENGCVSSRDMNHFCSENQAENQAAITLSVWKAHMAHKL